MKARHLMLGAALALLPCSAEAAVACAASATGVAFGSFTGSARTGTGVVTVTCEGNGATQVSVALTTGASGRYEIRRLFNGADTVAYNLYLDPSHAQIWGDGTSGTDLLSDVIQLRGEERATRTATVYGLIPQQPVQRAGTYVDTLTVIVEY